MAPAIDVIDSVVASSLRVVVQSRTPSGPRDFERYQGQGVPRRDNAEGRTQRTPVPEGPQSHFCPLTV